MRGRDSFRLFFAPLSTVREHLAGVDRPAQYVGHQGRQIGVSVDSL